MLADWLAFPFAGDDLDSDGRIVFVAHDGGTGGVFHGLCVSGLMPFDREPVFAAGFEIIFWEFETTSE
jgi:hypothetical protein